MSNLTFNAVKAAKLKEKSYSIKDGHGLFLTILPSGGKFWAFRFSWLGKQQRISLGVFPDVDIKTARERRDTCRELILAGLDPRLPRREVISTGDVSHVGGVLFRDYAEKWKAFKLKKLAHKKTSKRDNRKKFKELKIKPERQSTRIQIDRYFRLDFFPALGDRPLKAITRMEVLGVLKKIEDRGSLSIVEKCLTWLNEIFRTPLLKV